MVETITPVVSRWLPANGDGRVGARDVAPRLPGPVRTRGPHRPVDPVEHAPVVEPLGLIVDGPLLAQRRLAHGGEVEHGQTPWCGVRSSALLERDAGAVGRQRRALDVL